MSAKIVAFVSVKPGQEDASVAASRNCLAASRAEPKVLRYDLWQKAEGERRFVSDEFYVGDAAVQTHMTSDYLKVFGMAARDMAAARPSIIVAPGVGVAD